MKIRPCTFYSENSLSFLDKAFGDVDITLPYQVPENRIFVMDDHRTTSVETLQPTAMEEMCSGNWDLSLFTCTVDEKFRVTVRCERIDK